MIMLAALHIIYESIHKWMTGLPLENPGAGTAPLAARMRPRTLDEIAGQDEAGRLWDLVWMLRFGIIRAKPATSRLSFALYVRQSDTHPARLMTLRATAGAVDIDDPAPAITVMLPTED